MQIDHTKNIIELRNIFFSYGGEEILSDINLNIHKGDYLGIIGPNGGGKTTLLKIMLGLLQPISGEVKLFGKPIQEFTGWSKIGYVSQKSVNFDSNFPITVEEVVSMGRFAKRGLFKMLNSGDKKIIHESLEKVELTKYKNRIIGELSGGQQQRVFIARALAAQPEIIFLDEPTVGVDVQIQESFYKLLRKLNRELDLTLVLVSHDINVVAHEATEIALVNKSLVYDSNPQEFFTNDILKKHYGTEVKYILHNH